jgi:pimeloyl-ACP methyl ester carboxylesterase
MKYASPITRIAVALAFSLNILSSHAATTTPITNIVLVHGFFADGSGWQAVSKILMRDGYKVAVVQEPETSFDEDVKATTRVIDEQQGPSILVGHSYGGAVVTEAGNDDKVAGLVYVAAFQPDTAESPLDLTKKMPPASTSIKPTADGHLYIEQAMFHKDFCADLPRAEANYMAISQVTPAAEAFGVPIRHAAWRTKPSWAVVATADRAINPDLERFMTRRAHSTTIEINSSHVAYISHPAEVAKVIEEAARKSAVKD